MNLLKLPLIILIVALMCVPVACGPKREKTPRRMHRLPPPPPPVPARRNVAVDPALQQAARQEIFQAAESPNPVIRAHAMEAIRETMGPEAANVIIGHLTDNDPMVRFAAALAAGELRLAAARNDLLVLSDDKDPHARIGAKFALHRIGDTRQSRDLEKTSLDPNEGVRGNTALVLGLLGEPSARRVLTPMLADTKAAVRLQAAEALWRLRNDRGLDLLIGASISMFPDEQMFALLALAAAKDPRVLGHIEGQLTADYDETSLVAARAAGMVGSDAGYGVALKHIKSSVPQQRMLAALAFGAIGRADAQEYLAPLLKDEDADVRLAAATAILQLK